MAWIAGASLAAWVWLLAGQGFFWRTDVRLPSGTARRPPDGRPGAAQGLPGAAGDWPSVAVVIPARDEAAVLPASLPSVLAQAYPGRAEVFLVDDGSTDGTGELARALAAGHGGLPLTVTSPGEPAPGWTGKLWAVRHGMALAREHTDAEYLLLTDADIAHGPDSLRSLVSAARAADLDLVSQMARLRVADFWERLIVPAFVYFFGQLYPFRWVNRPGARTAAAAGGCVLLRRDAAERAGIPDRIRHAVIDDVTLARAVKRSGGRQGPGSGRIWLGLADHVDSVRPYPRLADLWRMVARSAYAQLLHSPLLLAGTVLGLALVYPVPPVALVAGLVAGAAPAAVLGGTAWALMAGTYVPMLRYYGLPPWTAPLLPFTALLYLLMTVDSAVQHYRGRGAAWKGRTYGAPPTGAAPGEASEGA